MTSPWLTQKEAAARARVALATFRALVRQGRMPPGHVVGKRRKLWHVDELDRAIEGKPTQSTDPVMAAINAAWTA